MKNNSLAHKSIKIFQKTRSFERKTHEICQKTRSFERKTHEIRQKTRKTRGKPTFPIRSTIRSSLASKRLSARARTAALLGS